MMRFVRKPIDENEPTISEANCGAGGVAGASVAADNPIAAVCRTAGNVSGGGVSRADRIRGQIDSLHTLRGEIIDAFLTIPGGVRKYVHDVMVRKPEAVLGLIKGLMPRDLDSGLGQGPERAAVLIIHAGQGVQFGSMGGNAGNGAAAVIVDAA